MTVCIGAIAEDGFLVGCADRQMTGTLKFDANQPKTRAIAHDCDILLSGDPTAHDEAIGLIEQRIRDGKVDPSHNSLVNAYARALSDVRNKRIETKFLYPKQLDLAAYFQRRGRAVVLKELDEAISQYDEKEWSADCLMVGYEGNRPQLHTITRLEAVSCTQDAFGVVGTGSTIAYTVLKSLRYRATTPTLQALFLVYYAKRMAEWDPYVGKETDLFQAIGPNLRNGDDDLGWALVTGLDDFFRDSFERIATLQDGVLREFVSAMQPSTEKMIADLKAGKFTKNN